MSLRRTLFSLVWLTLIFAAFNRGGGPFASHVVLTVTAFLAVALVVFRRLIPGWRKEDFSLRFMWIHGVYALFCLVVALSIGWGLTPEHGLSELLLFINGGIFMFLISGLDTSDGDLLFFAQGTVGIVTLITLVGFGFYLQSPVDRLAGTFLYPSEPQNAAFNTYANVLLLVLPLSCWYALQSFKKKASLYYAVGAAGMLLAGLILTFSRAAYVSLMAVFAAYIVWLFVLRKKIMHEQKVRIAVRLISVVLAAAVFFFGLQLTRTVFFATTSLSDKLLFEADEGSGSMTERLDYWRAAVNIIQDYPVLGAGVLSFRFLYPPEQYKFGINEDHPHNIFLKIGVENGVFAAGLFLIFVVAIAILALRFSFKNPWHPAFFLVMGAGMALVHNLIDFNFIVSNFLLFMVASGVLLASAHELQRFEISRAPVHGQRGSYAIVTAVFLISLSVTALALREAYFNRDLQAARRLVADGELEEATPHLERAKQLFFKRDFYKVYSDYFRAQFASTGDDMWLAEELEWLPGNLAVGTIDADYYERTGENLLAETSQHKNSVGELGEARDSFCMALRADPQNSLKYYYLFIKEELVRADLEGRTLTPENLTDSPQRYCDARRLDVLLNEYELILSRNEHFTILTENPEYASKLYELLNLKEDKARFDKEWKTQIGNFILKFGDANVPALP